MKLLDLAHQNCWKAVGITNNPEGLPGFLVLHRDLYNLINMKRRKGRGHRRVIKRNFRHLRAMNLDLNRLAREAAGQWDTLDKVFNGPGGDDALAFITPGYVTNKNAQDYRGVGTLIFANDEAYALILDNTYLMNGGYGSKLSKDFTSKLPPILTGGFGGRDNLFSPLSSLENLDQLRKESMQSYLKSVPTEDLFGG